MEPKEQLVEYARTIAVQRGYTDLVNGLQPLKRPDGSGLLTKFDHEVDELRHAMAPVPWQGKTWLHVLHEVADVLYYAACIDAQTGLESYHPLVRDCLKILRVHGLKLSVLQLEACALAKYAYRSSATYTKDEAHELRLIEEAVATGLPPHKEGESYG